MSPRVLQRPGEHRAKQEEWAPAVTSTRVVGGVKGRARLVYINGKVYFHHSTVINIKKGKGGVFRNYLGEVINTFSIFKRVLFSCIKVSHG